MKNYTLQTINAAYGLAKKIIISKKSYWQKAAAAFKAAPMSDDNNNKTLCYFSYLIKLSSQHS